MQNLDVFCSQGAFFLHIPLKIPRKSIGNSINLALIMIDPEIVSGQLLNSTNLPKAQVFHIYKAVLLIMIY